VRKLGIMPLKLDLPEMPAADLVTVLADPSPAVRKKASWYAPGGPIYRRTEPRGAAR
jgi:hypothetical protein